MNCTTGPRASSAIGIFMIGLFWAFSAFGRMVIISSGAANIKDREQLEKDYPYFKSPLYKKVFLMGLRGTIHPACIGLTWISNITLFLSVVLVIWFLISNNKVVDSVYGICVLVCLLTSCWGSFFLSRRPPIFTKNGTNVASNSSMKKQKSTVLVFIIILVLALIGIGYEVPQTIREAAEMNERLNRTTVSQEGFIHEIWTLDDKGYAFSVEGHDYTLCVYAEMVKDAERMSDLQAGAKVYYEVPLADREAANTTDASNYLVRSLKTDAGEIVDRASYERYIKEKYQPLFQMRTFFSCGCLICAAVSIAVLLKTSIRPKEKSPPDGEEPPVMQ